MIRKFNPWLTIISDTVGDDEVNVLLEGIPGLVHVMTTMLHRGDSEGTVRGQ